jgi:hypothetical protein
MVKGGSSPRFTSPDVVFSLWVVNLLTYAAICAWILFDGRFPQNVDLLRAIVRELLAGDGNQSLSWDPNRVMYLVLPGVLLGLFAMVSGIGVFVCLFVGARAHRRVRSWLAFTVLVAAWLTLAVTWREMAWQGQMLRLQWRLSGLDSVASVLLAEWPSVDGERPEIGQFMAYPQGDPKMLLLLTTPKIGHADVAISGIEKSSLGGLRFQLAGSESGAWLEWHPRETKPESFRGGLQTRYQLERSAPLADGWFLVRYRESF